MMPGEQQPLPDEQQVEEPEGEEESNVSPEEQKLYDLVMAQAHAMIYDEQGIQAVLQKLNALKDKPAQGIGHTAAMLIRSIKGGLKRAKIDVPDDVLFHAGTELVADITEIAVAAKIITEEQASEIGQEAVFEGLKTYGEVEMASGELTPKKQRAAQKQLDGAKELAPVAQAMNAGMPEGQPAGGLLEQGA